MTRQSPASLSRLARSNPVLVNDELGRTADAQATLSLILASEQSISARGVPGWRRRRLVVLVLAAMLLAAGAAVAATDPFGFWRSANPGTAMYGANPGRRVRTPTVYAVRCQRITATGFRCGPRLHGRPYSLIDQIQAPPPPNSFDREAIHRAFAHAVASGGISRETARRVDADLARVPDSFFAKYREYARFGTYSGGPHAAHGGKQLVPPPGVPSFLACQPAGALLTCQDLNGDENAPVGSGVYMAQLSPGWIPAPAHQHDPYSPTGRPVFSSAEYRLLRDLLVYGTTSTTPSGSRSSAP
jgi:hypothetical protein